ncbi:unnamed protein product [Dracunculus medinensis]|uniref:C2H2-type domain-containing protein n=1 Tax=Dracunculus medinensis TaxID=318479 RepID=A0A3P7Q3W4_DRAME|nr:unnamed protein product [Dracunculus medinensis]
MAGHKQYYCNNTNQVETFREPHKKIPNRCQQCDFQPISAAQLTQHVRINHSAIQAYICQLCGYKGYSQRGIRSHLRCIICILIYIAPVSLLFEGRIENKRMINYITLFFKVISATVFLFYFNFIIFNFNF